MNNNAEITCFFLNLDRSHGRRTHMEAQFERISIQAQRISAFDGTSLSDLDCLKYSPPETAHWKLSKAEIGCFLTHRMVWETIASGKSTYGAVFEDDIHFSNDAADFLRNSAWIPARTAFVKLDATHKPVLTARKRSLAGSDRSVADIHSVVLETSGYIISRICAACLLSLLAPMRAPVDVQMFNPEYRTFKKQKFKQILPAICIQQHHLGDNPIINPDVEQSTIAGFRSEPNLLPNPKLKTGFAKIKRELYRPFRPLGTLFFWVIERMRVKRTWTDIRFRH